MSEDSPTSEGLSHSKVASGSLTSRHGSSGLQVQVASAARQKLSGPLCPGGHAHAPSFPLQSISRNEITTLPRFKGKRIRLCVLTDGWQGSRRAWLEEVIFSPLVATRDSAFRGCEGICGVACEASPDCGALHLGNEVLRGPQRARSFLREINLVAF